MPLDTSIYFKGPQFNTTESLEKGVRLGQLIRGGISDMQDRQRAEQANNAYLANLQTGPDGQPTLNRKGFMRGLMETGQGQLAGQYQQQWAKEDAAKKQQEIENQFRQQQLADSAANRRAMIDERRYLAGIQLQNRMDEKAQKLADREATLAIPGYEREGTVLPKAEEAQKFRAAAANADELTSKLSRLRELVKDKGSFELGGTSGQEMETLATEIQLLGKGPELYQLGVLTGPDLKLLERITSDPTSLNSLFTRDKTRLKQIDTQLGSIEQKLQSKAKSLGYRKAPMQGGPERKIINGVNYIKVEGGWLPE